MLLVYPIAGSDMNTHDLTHEFFAWAQGLK
jgi:hypothetical protein